MVLPVSPNSSLVEDEVSRKKIALSATLTSCSFLTTLLTMSSLVMISMATAGAAMKPPRMHAITPIQTFDLFFIIALRSAGPRPQEMVWRHRAYAAPRHVRLDLGPTMVGPPRPLSACPVPRMFRFRETVASG